MTPSVTSCVKTSLFQLSWQIVREGNKPCYSLSLTNVSPTLFPACMFTGICLFSNDVFGQFMCPHACILCILDSMSSSITRSDMCQYVFMRRLQGINLKVLRFVMHVNMNDAKNARDGVMNGGHHVCMWVWTAIMNSNHTDPNIFNTIQSVPLLVTLNWQIECSVLLKSF